MPKEPTPATDDLGDSTPQASLRTAFNQLVAQAEAERARRAAAAAQPYNVEDELTELAKKAAAEEDGVAPGAVLDENVESDAPFFPGQEGAEAIDWEESWDAMDGETIAPSDEVSRPEDLAEELRRLKERADIEEGTGKVDLALEETEEEELARLQKEADAEDGSRPLDEEDSESARDMRRDAQPKGVPSEVALIVPDSGTAPKVTKNNLAALLAGGEGDVPPGGKRIGEGGEIQEGDGDYNGDGKVDDFLTNYLGWFTGLGGAELRFLLCVLFAGFIGAVCANLIGKKIMVMDFAAEVAQPLGYFSAGFIGAIAAGLGVYLLANSNTTQRMRTLFFAVGCGLCGQIIIAKTISTIEDSVGNKGQSQRVVKALMELKESIAQKGNTQELASAEKAHDWVITLIDRARAAEAEGDFELRTHIEGQAVDLVTNIMILSQKYPDRVVNFIGRIIARSEEAGADKVNRHAIESLVAMRIPDTAEDAQGIAEDRLHILSKITDFDPTKLKELEGSATLAEATMEIQSSSPPAPQVKVSALPDTPPETGEVASKQVSDPRQISNQQMTPNPSRPEEVEGQTITHIPSEPTASGDSAPASIEPGGGGTASPPPAAPATVAAPTAKVAGFGGRAYLEVDRQTLNMEVSTWKKLPGLENYTFIRPKTASDPDDSECRVLYYYDGDAAGAQDLYDTIVGHLGDFKLGARQGVVKVPGIKGARPKHFDVRIGRKVAEALKAKIEAATPKP
jgi:fluoride ion exporter CrcB/FEX